MSALSRGGHSENGFSIDPSSTQAFKAIGSIKDHLVHRRDAVDPAKLKAVVIGGGTGAPMSIRTLLSL